MNIQNQKNPHVILDEIAKRLNRIAGGTRVFSLHEAIKIAKEDTTKSLECFLFIKQNIIKISQPTAASQQTVDSIVELINNFSGNLSIEEIEKLNSEHVFDSFDDESINDTFTKDTNTDNKIWIKHTITEEDLKNNPELIDECKVGDEIEFEAEKVIVDQQFLDEHPELGDAYAIGDEIIWDSETQDTMLFSELEEISDSEDFDDESIDESIEDSDKVDNATTIESTTQSSIENTTKEELPKQNVINDEKLEVKASKTFDGKKTKVTKKLITSNSGLEKFVNVGDFIFIDNKQMTAFIASTEEHSIKWSVKIGEVIVLSVPLPLN